MMKANGFHMQPIVTVIDKAMESPTKEYIDTLLEPSYPTEARVQVIHNNFAKTLREYMDVWASPSLKRFGRSTRTSHVDNKCSVGDRVFFWRPRKGKLDSCWKEATVLDISRDGRIITIRRMNGSVSNEYYYNIAILDTEAAPG
ncbi:hypothetical protein FOZ63_024253, partial [Perkinsus olseni]